MRPASEITGRGADTRRFVVGLSAPEARSNTTPTKNTRRPSRSRSRRARTTRWVYANSLTDSADATIDDLVEAVEVLEPIAKSWKRVMGERHPETQSARNSLESAREKLRHLRAASVGNSA